VYEIASRLKKVRENLKIKQKDMAKAMNIAPSYLCEIEKGRRDPGPEFFIKFAWIYHVNLNFLFFDAVDMFVDDEGVIKKEDLDISTEIDTIQKVTWFMENSVHIKSLIFMTLNKALYLEKEIIKQDLDRSKKQK
jgi:transcriptional regulator with XRE-family HTH domain